MHTKQKARAEATGSRKDHVRNSTSPAPLRQRVQLSAQLACTFVSTASPLRLDVHWHGKGNPSRMGALALTRYRRARDAFIERLALAAGETWAVAETDTGYVRCLGLPSCDVGGNA